jgi:hypothetical protein
MKTEICVKTNGDEWYSSWHIKNQRIDEEKLDIDSARIKNGLDPLWRISENGYKT